MSAALADIAAPVPTAAAQQRGSRITSHLLALLTLAGQGGSHPGVKRVRGVIRGLISRAHLPRGERNRDLQKVLNLVQGPQDRPSVIQCRSARAVAQLG